MRVEKLTKSKCDRFKKNVLLLKTDFILRYFQNRIQYTITVNDALFNGYICKFEECDMEEYGRFINVNEDSSINSKDLWKKAPKRKLVFENEEGEKGVLITGSDAFDICTNNFSFFGLGYSKEHEISNYELLKMSYYNSIKNLFNDIVDAKNVDKLYKEKLNFIKTFLTDEFSYYMINIYLNGKTYLGKISRCAYDDANLFEIELEENLKFFISKDKKINTYEHLVYDIKKIECLDSNLIREKNIYILCSIKYSILLAKVEARDIKNLGKSKNKYKKNKENEKIYFMHTSFLINRKRSPENSVKAQLLNPDLFLKVKHHENLSFVYGSDIKRLRSEADEVNRLMKKNIIDRIKS